MTDEFKKARDKATWLFHEKEWQGHPDSAMRVSFGFGADWAYEWQQKRADKLAEALEQAIDLSLIHI